MSLEEFLIKADKGEIKNELTKFYEIIKNKKYKGYYLGKIHLIRFGKKKQEIN